MRILHTGDLHIGRSSKAAERGEEARMKALDNVIRAAEEEECDYMVIAGNFFEPILYFLILHRVKIKLFRQIQKV